MPFIRVPQPGGQRAAFPLHLFELHNIRGVNDLHLPRPAVCPELPLFRNSQFANCELKKAMVSLCDPNLKTNFFR